MSKKGNQPSSGRYAYLGVGLEVILLMVSIHYVAGKWKLTMAQLSSLVLSGELAGRLIVLCLSFFLSPIYQLLLGWLRCCLKGKVISQLWQPRSLDFWSAHTHDEVWLWPNTAQFVENRTCDSKHISALTLEKAATSRRFDTIFECCTFREKPIRSSLMSNAQHQWFMVIDFVNAVRQHCQPFFNPRLDVRGRVHCEVVRRRSLDRYRIPSICFIGEKTWGWLRDT